MALAQNNISRNYSTAMFVVCCIFTAIVLGLVALIVGYLFYKGFSFISVAFLTTEPKAYGVTGFPGGMASGILGTAELVGVAALAGIPIGMLTGVYLSEYGANSILAKAARFFCDVLSGVPSIVVGILGYELLVAPSSHVVELLGLDGKFNGYAGAFALAFIMVPIVARTTEEMLRLVPKSYREASIALGATRARTILRVVIPSASSSLITGVMLAIARIAGETAPLLFTALGSRYITTDLKYAFPSLTTQVYNAATSPYKLENQQAWAGMLVLISMIFIVNLSMRVFVRSRVKAAS